MSIVDNQVERQEAELRLGTADHDRLLGDLAFWKTAARRASSEFVALTERRGALQVQYAEADTWCDLIADELIRRSDERIRSERIEEPG